MDSTAEQNSSIPITISRSLGHFQESLKDTPVKDLKKSTRAKPVRKTIVVKGKVETYSLDELGTIENAKKHQDANRPLHMLKELDESVKFCHCCDLPCESKGVIEPFKVSDDFNNKKKRY